MSVLRRFVAMLLLALFGLPLVSSSLALGQDTEAGLPACCRRTGQHHCAMSTGERLQVGAAAAQAPHWKAPAPRCPYCPAAAANVHADAVWLRPGSTTVSILPAAAGPVPQAACAHRLARERARPERGPPASFLV